MAVLDDLNKAIGGIDKISKDGIPVEVKHELDTSSVSYLALMAFLVVIGCVVLVGVKDVVVKRITRT